MIVDEKGLTLRLPLGKAKTIAWEDIASATAWRVTRVTYDDEAYRFVSKQGDDIRFYEMELAPDLTRSEFDRLLLKYLPNVRRGWAEELSADRAWTESIRIY